MHKQPFTSPTSGLSIKSDGRPTTDMPKSVVRGVSNENRSRVNTMLKSKKEDSSVSHEPNFSRITDDLQSQDSDKPEAAGL